MGARRDQKFWTPERVAVLRREWKAGALAFDIANLIGAGCTRSAVIGKAYRLRLGPIIVNTERASERISESMKVYWASERAQHRREHRAG